MRKIVHPAIRLLLVSATLCFATDQTVTNTDSPQRVPITAEEQRESYAIYSAVLKTREPRIDNWTIVDETRYFGLCTRAAPEVESIYRGAFDDYASRNRRTIHLEGNFGLARYSMAPAMAWGVTRGQWNFAVFSRVGFNSELTRAVICFMVGTGGTCSVLVKKEGQWVMDREFRGEGCGWSG